LAAYSVLVLVAAGSCLADLLFARCFALLLMLYSVKRNGLL
jgi:hypothetical protein